MYAAYGIGQERAFALVEANGQHELSILVVAAGSCGCGCGCVPCDVI